VAVDGDPEFTDWKARPFTLPAAAFPAAHQFTGFEMMRFDAIETVTVSDRKPGGPIVLMQVGSRLAAIAHAVILLPACLMMLAPFALVAARASDLPAARELITSRPMAALQLTVAFLIAGAFCALAVHRLTSRLGRGTRVEISQETVRVREYSILGEKAWSAPLPSFSGVRHRVRSTLNGTRHELVLEHPDARRTLLIEIAPQISDARIGEVAASLRLPVLAAGGGAHFARTTTNQPALAAAA
jgi:hypothetical protein